MIGQRGTSRTDDIGLDRQDGSRRVAGRVGDVDLGERGRQLGATVSDRLDDAQRLGGGVVGHGQTGEQGLAHAPATDDLKAGHEPNAIRECPTVSRTVGGRRSLPGQGRKLRGFWAVPLTLVSKWR